jgi:DNA-binding response OmpR family regulator
MLLDLMLPGDVDGLQVCQAVRRGETYIPIIMVTAKDEDVDKIVGLEMGADDYITKPFNTRELLARVRAVLRLVRGGGEVRHHECLHIGSLEIDLAGREVRVESRPVSLTPKEFDLLVVLARSPGRVFGRETSCSRCGDTTTWVTRAQSMSIYSACAKSWSLTRTIPATC